MPFTYIVIYDSVIRLEIDCYFSKYYTELDAVLLVGTLRHPTLEETLKISVSGLMRQIVNLGLHQLGPEYNIVENIKRVCLPTVSSVRKNQSYLDKLPVS